MERFGSTTALARGSYGVRVGPGYLRLESHMPLHSRQRMLLRRACTEASKDSGALDGGESDAAGTHGRGAGGFRQRSRQRALLKIANLPWQEVGARMVLVTLTYPSDWGRWVGDGRVWEAHRKAFVKRWERRWGPMLGVWGKEFTRRGAPHIHLYVGLPDAVTDGDWQNLVARTKRAKGLEGEIGKYHARRLTPAVGGDFGEWARRAWCEVVGTMWYPSMRENYRRAVAAGCDDSWLTFYYDHGGGHSKAGVDIRVWYFGDRPERKADRIRAASYVAAEMSKMGQKAPPADFGVVGRYFGVLGEGRGFREVVPELEFLDPTEFLMLRRRAWRWMAWRREVRRRRFDLPRQEWKGMPWDGITVLGLGSELSPEKVERMREYARRAAARYRAKHGDFDPSAPLDPARGGWRDCSEE